jgi:hypothetical protein
MRSIGRRVQVDDAALLKSPHLWPEFPFLRVDRRTTPRPGAGICFLRTNDVGEVDPVVYVTTSWPPKEDEDPMIVVSFAFQDMQGLIEQGWKVVDFAY